MIICMSFTAMNEYGEYVHTLTVDEIPNHIHSQSYNDLPMVSTYRLHGDENYETYGWQAKADTAFKGYAQSTYQTGGDKAHNNLQPCIATYFWKRII